MTRNPIYINGLGNVSPQKTTDGSLFLEEPISYETNRLKIIDPVYKDFIPAELIRRMSRIIKMGIAASKICLKDAGIDPGDSSMRNITPDAIITGTGLGCIEDTEKFLTTMIRNSEEFLTPTSFIQSTHNTVAGQIALLLKCHGYNFTYVHRGISFESALLDAITHFRLGEFSNVLVGGSDELTANSFAITSRLGYWKQKPVRSLNLLIDSQRGSVAGEGASFLFLENQMDANTYAELRGVTTILRPSSTREISKHMHRFLSDHGLTTSEIDALILGLNGNPATDRVYHDLAEIEFPGVAKLYFKHLCGEYHTASSFATWMAAMIIKKQVIPEIVKVTGSISGASQPPAIGALPKVKIPVSARLDHILIYNHFQENNHAFILLSRP